MWVIFRYNYTTWALLLFVDRITSYAYISMKFFIDAEASIVNKQVVPAVIAFCVIILVLVFGCLHTTSSEYAIEIIKTNYHWVSFSIQLLSGVNEGFSYLIVFLLFVLSFLMIFIVVLSIVSFFISVFRFEKVE